jgi:hypothetical protein
MDRSTLKLWARALVPGATATKIPNALLESIIQEGANDVALHTCCLPSDATFDAEEDIGTYYLGDIADDILEIAESGLWYKNGTQWKELLPKTRAWMDENVSNWRDRASGTPEWWFKEGDAIEVIPAPASLVNEGLWLYYGAKPPVMGNDDHFPFGGDSEIAYLSPLSHNILDFVRWKAHEILGETAVAQKYEQSYYAKLSMARVHVKRNAAMQGYKETKLRGRVIA